MDFSSKAVVAGSDSKNDLKITLEVGGSGRHVEIQSRVQEKFGEAIREDVITILDEYQIKDVQVLVEDLGALDYAVKARVETAVKRALYGQKEG